MDNNSSLYINSGNSDANGNINYFTNILLGIVAAMIIYRICIKPRNIHGPNSKDIIGKKYYYKGHYYELVPEIYECK